MSVTLAQEPPFQNIARHASKLMDPYQKGYYNFAAGETWTPSVNLYETDECYLVCVDLAGVDKEKIDVEVVDGRLKFRGQRVVPNPGAGSEPDWGGKRVRVHLMEIDHGGFHREVELPNDAAPARISATYRNGMLWIEIPRK